MRALVTGAGGFVGANLVGHLLAAGHDVAAVVRPTGDRWRLDGFGDDVATIECDLESPIDVERMVVTHAPEAIFHLAAHGAYSWQQDFSKMLAVNLQCTEALLTAATQLGARLVNAGSSSEYGYKDHPPREHEISRPNSHYAVTKLAATHLCELAADQHGTHALTLRLYSVYGPFEEPGRLMPTLVRAARTGGWPPLVNPDTARDFVWIGDVCRAFELAATCDLSGPGLVFNIASGTQTTLAQLVNTTAEVFAVRAEPTWGSMEQRAWDTSVWVGDPSLAGDELGWRAETSVAQGLRSLADWFDDHPELEGRY